MEVIGFTGAARSGKDTAAQALVSLGWRRIALADPIREMLWALNPYVHVGGDVFRALRYVVDIHGWETAKDFSDVRRLLQRLGTEAGRDILGESVWIDVAQNKLNVLSTEEAMDMAMHGGKKCFDVVVTDIRFENEAQWIRDNGGRVIRITRDGAASSTSHISESGIPDSLVYAVVENNGTIEELHEKVSKLRAAIHIAG